MLDPKKENILLLGMVFSEQLLPERGQKFRDRFRCMELERLGLPISWSSLHCNWLSKSYCKNHKRTAIKEEVCNWLSNHKRTASAAADAMDLNQKPIFRQSLQLSTVSSCGAALSTAATAVNVLTIATISGAKTAQLNH